MCSFFSMVSKGDGVPMYFDWELRKKCLSRELNYNPDSHTSIADYFGFNGKREDRLNKYEYNPITQEFVIDQLNTKDDSESIKSFCLSLDFSTIVPALICKEPVHPFAIHNDVTQEDIDNLVKWASVRASVRASVGDSVWDSVWDSVRASVRASVWDSVWDSVWAYTSSFFNIEYKHDYSCLIALWHRGFVPSFDGTTWRLHSGENAKIVYERRK